MTKILRWHRSLSRADRATVAATDHGDTRRRRCLDVGRGMRHARRGRAPAAPVLPSRDGRAARPRGSRRSTSSRTSASSWSSSPCPACRAIGSRSARSGRAGRSTATRSLPIGDSRHRVRRLEIPYGAFERRIALPPAGSRSRRPSWSQGLPRGPRAASSAELRTMDEPKPGAEPRRPARCSTSGGRPPHRRPRRRRRASAADSRRRADRSAGAQPGAVPGDGLPDRRRPRELAGGRAGSGAARAADRRAAAAPSPRSTSPGADDLHQVGTSAAVLRYVTTPDGSHHVVARGLHRFRVARVPRRLPVHGGSVEYVDETGARRPRGRGPRPGPEGARARDPAAAAAGAAGDERRPAGHRRPGDARQRHRERARHRARRRSSRCSRPST